VIGLAVPGRARRRLAAGLVGFGVTGLALIVAGGALVLGTIGSIGDAAVNLQGQRASLVALIGPAADAMEHAATSAKNAGQSLSSSANAARDAADVTAQLADAMTRMAGAARVSILGTQPFGSVADEFDRVAEQSTRVSQDLRDTAGVLDRNVTDAGTSGDDLARLATELRALDRSLDESPSTEVEPIRTVLDVTRIVLLGLLAWLAAPAIAALWLGWRLLAGARSPRSRRVVRHEPERP
jgi:hypothetical protein